MLELGQILRGRVGSYQLTRQLQDSVWLAINQQAEQKIIVKYVEHFRIGNERDVLRRFQGRTPHIRPLLDEIELENKGEWPALVLRWLDDDLLRASNSGKLTHTAIKRVGKNVLQALAVLHDDGFVHTDVKPSNVLANFDPLSKNITEVQLADLESTVHRDSSYAKDGDSIGTPIFRSTEAMLQMRWDTATDVWSFGTMMISLLYGGNFHIFEPGVPVDDDEYELKILMRHHKFFGPFPFSYMEIADGDRIEILTWVMNNTPRESRKPFRNVSRAEISAEDKEFLLKIMKLDRRDRPTARDLLKDEWFTEEVGRLDCITSS